MKRIMVTLVLLAATAGCGNTQRRTIMPGPHPTNDEAYVAGFMDGYKGVRPVDLHARDTKSNSYRRSYKQGLKEGYLARRRDEIQWK